MPILSIFCCIFYAVLCIFSIGTGILYFSGKRKLNPIELSDNMVKKLSSEEKKKNFSKIM